MIHLLWVIVAGTMLLAILSHVWPLLLFAAVTWAVIKLAGIYFDDRAVIRRNHADEIRRLIARADKQNQQILSGATQEGTYGKYMPPEGLR